MDSQEPKRNECARGPGRLQLQTLLEEEFRVPALTCCHALNAESSMSICAVVWCDRAAVARGLCKRCYARYKRGLGPNETRQYMTRETKDQVRDAATERRMAGESIAVIAASVGVTESTLGKWFRE